MLPKAHPLPDGPVIMFEGIDGAGKTTQIELARKALERAGWAVLATRNLGGTPIGEALREVIKSPLERPPLTDFYVSLAIQEPLLEVIGAARREGKIILMDRGPLSLAAYQIYGSGVDGDIGWKHVAASMARLAPEAVILYDMEPGKALERKSKARGESDYFESKTPDYFQKVARGFREAAERYSIVTTINADQSVEAVHERTMSLITPLLA